MPRSFLVKSKRSGSHSVSGQTCGQRSGSMNDGHGNLDRDRDRDRDDNARVPWTENREDTIDDPMRPSDAERNDLDLRLGDNTSTGEYICAIY